MGDSKRFDLFAKLIQRNFPPSRYHKIADIAGGKGYLQPALRPMGYDVTTYDKPRSKHSKRNIPNRFQYNYQLFTDKIKTDFDILVGMHPDEATDIIIVQAAKRKIPFVVCPCCVKPEAVVYWGKHTYHLWCNHLERLARKLQFDIRWLLLPMNGKNKVLIGR